MTSLFASSWRDNDGVDMTKKLQKLEVHLVNGKIYSRRREESFIYSFSWQKSFSSFM
jgi:hypothetical protein